MFVRVRAHTHTHTHMHVRMHTHTHTHACTHAHLYKTEDNMHTFNCSPDQRLVGYKDKNQNTHHTLKHMGAVSLPEGGE